MKEERLIGNSGIQEVRQQCLDLLAEIREQAGILNDYFEVTDNPEYIAAWVDGDGKLVFGFKTDGKTFVGDADFLDDLKSIKEFLPLWSKVDWDALSIITLTEDPEGRSEVTTDSEGKVISYRDSNGVKHEEVGINTSKLTLTEDGVENLKEQLDGVPVKKNWYLPKFGRVNIKAETFYLTADPRWSTKDDVVCIQMYDDTDANAEARKTLSYYYIKSTLTPTATGGYDRTSVNENSVQLELTTGKDTALKNGHYYTKITKVNNQFYITSTLDKDSEGIYHVSYIYGNRLMSVPINYTDDSIPDQTTLSDVYEVTPITDVPPYKAWPVTKKLEHYCLADIELGIFYNGTNVPLSVKYQGSGSLNDKKRSFRLTFYKKNDYKKKAKIKIGEMLRLSGFNMKSYGYDVTRIKEPILMHWFIEMWETKGDKAYPWNEDKLTFNGANGMIKAFPVETWFGDEFFGLQNFGIKKDEKNYLLDGDDDSSGIFVSGLGKANSWSNGNHTCWEDEMMDEMSQSTAEALDELHKYIKGFIDGTIEIDGQVVEFTNSMLEEHIDIISWIDYWIGLQMFTLADNEVHNMILYSGRDKKMFYAFPYDLDDALFYYPDQDFVESRKDSGSTNIYFWEKLSQEYKDIVLNRYVQLRKTILSAENIAGIYEAYINSIPQRVIISEQERWGVKFNPVNFKESLNYIKERIKYLDDNCFFLHINN